MIRSFLKLNQSPGQKALSYLAPNTGNNVPLSMKALTIRALIPKDTW